MRKINFLVALGAPRSTKGEYALGPIASRVHKHDSDTAGITLQRVAIRPTTLAAKAVGLYKVPSAKGFLMSKAPSVTAADLSMTSVPAFWPMAMAAALWEQGAELVTKNLKFVEEDIKIHNDLRPMLATPNQVRLDLRTMVLREYGRPGGIPTLVDAPHAGHTAMIADYHKGQSLIETLLANGIGHVALTDWKTATDDMKDLEIDNYLAELIVAIDDLGGRVNLVGLCQGGWVSAMLAARFPDKVNSLVLAGAPIDTDAGDGPITRMVHESPASFYEELVTMGGGLMRGKFMLQGWKNMHAGQRYF